jgi:hypothetical protein
MRFDAPGAFSVAMSGHLRDYMDEHGLDVDQVAAQLDDPPRSASYVRDCVTGVLSPDTDLLNVVARLSGTDVRSLLVTLMSRM